MSLAQLRVRDFRCLTDLGIEPDPEYNLIYGQNASGKTSLLEAIFYLGRGRSFRAARPQAVVRDGADCFEVVGQLGPDGRVIGLRGERQGLTARLGGEPVKTLAELAAALPVQVIDPNVHELIEGGPGMRRRFLDQGVFHVKHGFLRAWQRYQRALKQRNAALRAGQSAQAIGLWDSELLEMGAELERFRRDYLSDLRAIAVEVAEKLLGLPISLSYHPGWAGNVDLEAALAGSLERDQKYGATQVGPHRADLVVEVRERKARSRVSRGQQKLLASALVLAQAACLGQAMGRGGVLLLDDPAAELDMVSLGRLMDVVDTLQVQRFVTGLRQNVLNRHWPGKVFHVEQGGAQQVI